MSVGWRCEYDPDHAHVAGGIPAHVVTEVERLAGQLVDLAGMGVDVSDYGNGPRAGGSGTEDARRNQPQGPKKRYRTAPFRLDDFRGGPAGDRSRTRTFEKSP
ncbi:hypothetical protein ACPEIC_13735 [Stenotrophomonas sp. NPDC087984]